ncbi:hypothetical protein C8J56DRAFT_367666 [Mycena floridula]|nr:hypothetical protein C8J56DRAFT_367666 [Mycena floridula]
MLALLPIHFFTHRFSPQTLEAPILALGPSELDYEFVKFGLQQWPWRNWILYGALKGLGDGRKRLAEMLTLGLSLLGSCSRFWEDCTHCRESR